MNSSNPWNEEINEIGYLPDVIWFPPQMIFPETLFNKK